MHYIKDLFENKDTEHAHNKFIRYSKGEFVGPLVKIKVSKNNVKVNASFHLASEILEMMADVLGNKEIAIKGNLSWNKDLAPELEETGIKYLKVVKSRGIFNYKLDNTVRFSDMVKNLGNYHLLVSFKHEDMKLTTKPKYPKPNKEIGADFCKSVFPGSYTKTVLKEFAFDVKEAKIKDIEIRHEIVVDDIKLPDVDNFEEARKLAKRCGILRRYVSVNKEEEVMSEVKFEI